MEEIDFRPNKLKIAELIKNDLNKFKHDKKINSNYALGLYFESNSNISERAIRRVLSNDNYLPQYSNIIEIYSVIYATRKLDELVLQVPEEIAVYLASKSQDNDLAKAPDSNMAINNYVLNNPLALKIYLLTTGHGIHLNKIIRKLGDDGLKETFKMAKREIVNVNAKQHVTRGRCSLVFNNESLKDVSTGLINAFYRPEATLKKSENLISVRFTSISENAYIKIIGEVEIANSKIQAIIKHDDLIHNAGEQTVKMFYTSVTDKIE